MDPAFGPTQTVTANGTTLAYVEHGDGEPVVFVHGALSDLRTWTAQVAALGDTHRAIAYSARYARPNADIAQGVDNAMATHVEDLAEFLHAIEASPAHLVGNSSGAFTCLMTAIRHPEAVRTLTLEEPPVMTLFVSTPPRARELLRLIARRPRTASAIVKMGATALGPAEKAFRRGDDREGMRRFLHGVLGRKHAERLSPTRLEQAEDNVAGLRAILVGEGGLAQVTEHEVSGVDAPTTLVIGAESPAFAQRLTDRLDELLPRSRRVEVPGASHLSHEDDPATVNRAILETVAA